MGVWPIVTEVGAARFEFSARGILKLSADPSMEPITHFMTGACLARAGFNRRAAYATVAMTLAAEAPDLDVLWSLRGPLAGFQHHRGITHTLVALPFEGLVVLGAVWLWHRWRLRRAREVPAKTADVERPMEATDEVLIRPLNHAPVRWGLLYGFVLIALLSHILLDWTNNYGVRPFFPFNSQWYAGSIVFVFDPVLFAVLLLALMAPALFGLIGSEVGARSSPFRGRGWAIFALVAMVAWWGLRWLEHDDAVEVASAAAYGPNSAGAEVLRVMANPYPGNPFLWHTVAETPKFYQAATVDTWHATMETDPERDLYSRPEATATVLAAKRSWLGEVYLDWSSWPLVAEIGPGVPADAPAGAPVWDEVSFRDLRFMYDTTLMQGRRDPPLAGTAYVDAAGRVEEIEFGGHVQR
jgi:inner membrane protein